MSNLSGLSKEELVDFLYGYCQWRDDLRGITKQIIRSSHRNSLDRARYAINRGSRPFLVTRLLAISIILDYAKQKRCQKQLNLRALCKKSNEVLFSAQADILCGSFPKALQGLFSRQLTLV